MFEIGDFVSRDGSKTLLKICNAIALLQSGAKIVSFFESFKFRNVKKEHGAIRNHLNLSVFLKNVWENFVF